MGCNPPPLPPTSTKLSKHLTDHYDLQTNIGFYSSSYPLRFQIHFIQYKHSAYLGYIKGFENAFAHAKF